MNTATKSGLTRRTLLKDSAGSAIALVCLTTTGLGEAGQNPDPTVAQIVDEFNRVADIVARASSRFDSIFPGPTVSDPAVQAALVNIQQECADLNNLRVNKYLNAAQEIICAAPGT